MAESATTNGLPASRPPGPQDQHTTDFKTFIGSLKGTDFGPLLKKSRETLTRLISAKVHIKGPTETLVEETEIEQLKQLEIQHALVEPNFEDFSTTDEKLTQLFKALKKNSVLETEKIKLITKNSEERILRDSALIYIGNAVQIEGISLLVGGINEDFGKIRELMTTLASASAEDTVKINQILSSLSDQKVDLQTYFKNLIPESGSASAINLAEHLSHTSQESGKQFMKMKDELFAHLRNNPTYPRPTLYYLPLLVYVIIE